MDCEQGISLCFLSCYSLEIILVLEQKWASPNRWANEALESCFTLTCTSTVSANSFLNVILPNSDYILTEEQKSLSPGNTWGISIPGATSLVVSGLNLSEMTVMEHRGTSLEAHRAVASPATPAPTTATWAVSMACEERRRAVSLLSGSFYPGLHLALRPAASQTKTCPVSISLRIKSGLCQLSSLNC